MLQSGDCVKEHKTSPFIGIFKVDFIWQEHFGRNFLFFMIEGEVVHSLMHEVEKSDVI